MLFTDRLKQRALLIPSTEAVCIGISA